MASFMRRELGMVSAWFIFPLVPVVLEDCYYRICHFDAFSNQSFGPDPREWGWFIWVLMLGPLLGYGFLAGATVDLPDDSGPPRRWWLRLAARRSVWVAIGPWWGSLVLVAIFFAIAFFDLWKTLQDLVPLQPEFWKGTWVGTVLTWAAVACLTAMWSYSWLWPARAALRRAARLNRLRHAFYRGLTIALAFVGSLFGSFWAATALWRSYFFDPRVMPLIVVAVGLAASSGCANTITYGEVRRRELFHAMLVAWVLGLALMWRWWSRRRA